MPKLWRIFTHGEPNNGKTLAAVETFPRPMIFINAPGEKGYASIPDDDPEVHIAPTIDPYAKPQEILKALDEQAVSVIKSGKYQTIIFEGLHKYMEYVLDDVTLGAHFRGDEFGWKAYSQCYAVTNRFMDRLQMNNTPVVYVTSWSREKADKNDPLKEKAALYARPKLLGDYAQMIVGEFGCVFHQFLQRTDNKDKNGNRIYERTWQTKPQGRVKGCGIKGPPQIVSQIPLYIPADFRYLSSLWDKLSAEVK